MFIIPKGPCTDSSKQDFRKTHCNDKIVSKIKGSPGWCGSVD